MFDRATKNKRNYKGMSVDSLQSPSDITTLTFDAEGGGEMLERNVTDMIEECCKKNGQKLEKSHKKKLSPPLWRN